MRRFKRLRLKRLKKIYHSNLKKAEVVILISDKIDFNIKRLGRDKEGDFIMKKGPILGSYKNVHYLKRYETKIFRTMRRPKYPQKHYRTNRLKNRNIENVGNMIKKIDLMDIFWNTAPCFRALSFQVHMKHLKHVYLWKKYQRNAILEYVL